MESLWKQNPDDRPSFTNVRKKLESVIDHFGKNETQADGKSTKLFDIRESLSGYEESIINKTNA